MAFLGLTFAATISKQPAVRRNIAVAAPGAVLLLGALLGAATASAVAKSVALHAGVVSFGVAALLYLVTGGGRGPEPSPEPSPEPELDPGPHPEPPARAWASPEARRP
eukprot:2778189-Prymnesium_polylepis.2